jgi:sugar lactone lactonase YvrE
MPVTIVSPTPGAVITDSNSSFPAGDVSGVWISDANTGGTAAALLRYAPDSGRWLQVALVNPAPFVDNQCMVSDGNGTLYVLQFDGANAFFSVIDTNASGDTSHGMESLNGVTSTFTLTDQLGGSFNTLTGLIYDNTSGTLWTYSENTANNSNPGLYKINPNTGSTTYFDISPTLGFGFINVSDIFAANGAIYFAMSNSQGYTYQFPISGGVINNGTAVGPINIYDGGLNTGYLAGFVVDSTGLIYGCCQSSDTTIVGNNNGYVVIDPSTFTLTGGVSSTNEGVSLAIDGNDDIWFLDNNATVSKYTSGSVTHTSTIGGGFGQSNPYSLAWLEHQNGEPNLFVPDASGAPGTLYAGADYATYISSPFVSTSFWPVGNDVDAPVTSHVTPGAIVVDPNNSLYPTDDKDGLWIASETRVARYSPNRPTDPKFILVALTNSTQIATNGISFNGTGNILYVLDQALSYVWVIDTTPFGGGTPTGVNGVVGFIDLTAQWPAGSARFVGLSYDHTADALLTSDGSAISYKIGVTSSPAAITTGALSGTARAMYAAGGSIYYYVTSGTGSPTFDQVDPTSLSSTSGGFYNFSLSFPVTGMSATGTPPGTFYQLACGQGNSNGVLVAITNTELSAAQFAGYPTTGVYDYGIAGSHETFDFWLAFNDTNSGNNYLVKFNGFFG